MTTDYEPDLVLSNTRLPSSSRAIAVVGVLPDPERPNHYVARSIQQQSYRIIPVNPHIDDALREKSYPDLEWVTDPLDMVDIFRRPEHVVPIVEQAIDVGAKYICMQDGVVNEKAAALAEAAGLSVVMDN